jgi:hypothetical protein
LELGLAVYPVGISGSYASSINTSARSREDSTAVGGMAIPISLMAYGRVPSSPQVTWILGAGLGYVMGGSYTMHSVMKEKSFTPTNTLTDDDTYSLDGGIGFRGTLGAEYALGRQFSLFIGVNLDAAHLGYASRSYSSTTVDDSSGKTVSTSSLKAAYGSGGMYKNPVSTSTTVSSGGYSTTTDTYDDGTYKSTEVRKTNLSTFETTYTNTYEVQNLKGPGVSIVRLAPMIAGTFRF